MRKILIGAFTIVMAIAVVNSYACPDHDKAKGQAEASKASMNSDNGSCPASANSGTKVKATVAKSTDNVPAVQIIEKKTDNKTDSKTAIRPANYKPSTTTDSAKDKKNTTQPNRQDMASVNKNN